MERTLEPTARQGAIVRPFIHAIHGVEPDLSQAAFVAPGAVIIGKVRCGPGSSIWYGCVVRGDDEDIVIGTDVNIQDGSILHADPDLPVHLGDRVSRGHGAIVHGAIVEDDVLIGMRATVLNGARIGAGSVVAAGAVVRPGMDVPPNSLVVGVPAKVRKEVGEAEREMIEHTTEEYRRISREHQAEIYG
jgi:carbonic anhydrase/acetyltransferase-like protein (isoleucine patch superfamily)